MAKTQPKIDDIKDLKKATITSDGLMSADDKIKLDSAYKPKGNIADKTALLALTNVKQGDVYNAQTAFTLINGQNVQNVKAGDNIVCLSDAATSEEANWDNLGGNIDFAAALAQALIGFSAESGSITSSDTILSAINKLAYDKHAHSNQSVLDLITAAFTTELKTKLDGIQADANKNRVIKVNAANLGADSKPITLVGDITPTYSTGTQEWELDFGNSLRYRGKLSDLTDLKNLSNPSDSGIWELTVSKTYYDMPSPYCGTLAERTIDVCNAELIVNVLADGSITQKIHFAKDNKYHIRTFNGTDWMPWERVITCEDKPQTIQADIEAESIYHLPIPATGTTDYTFYLNGFDGKNGDIININLGTIFGGVNMNKRVVEIYVSPAQPNIDVSFYCSGYSFYPMASYIDPLSVSGNIYYMKFIFLKQTTYWAVDNNIAYF